MISGSFCAWFRLMIDEIELTAIYSETNDTMKQQFKYVLWSVKSIL